jgi:hypothetical protein
MATAYVIAVFITVELRSFRRAPDLPALRCGTDQVPLVASDVEEHGDAAVGFRARCCHKLNARGRHPGACGIEIVHAEEEAHPATGLLPDGSSLIFSVSPREQQARHSTRWPDHNPPLSTPVVRQGRGVLRELEAQCVHEEADCWIVVVNHDGDEAEMHCTSIGGPVLLRLKDAGLAQRRLDTNTLAAA